MEMLQLNDLHKTFNPGTVNEKVALNGVSLHMEAGDFATIVGSNGAGKSTLFNAITDALAQIEKQNYGDAKSTLIAAQQKAEEMYITAQN